MTNAWLMKSEPEVYSIDDLARDRKTGWEGVRNYQARNSMRDGMKLGDLVLFYHSNATPSGIAGIAEVTRLAYPDPSQFDKKSEYYDAGSSEEAPRWLQVEIGFREKFARVVSLETLKADKQLDGMLVIRKGQRLSVQPVEEKHFDRVCLLAKAT